MNRLDLTKSSPNVPKEAGDVAGANVRPTAQVPFSVAGVVDGRLSEQRVLKIQKYISP